MGSNYTLNLSDKEQKQLDELVEFFQSKSIATVAKADVIKFLISRAHNFTQSKDLEKIENFYKMLGIDYNFRV